MLRETPTCSVLALVPVQILLLSGALLTGGHALAEHGESLLPSVTVGTTGKALSIDEQGSDTGHFNFEIELAVPAVTGSFSLLLEAGAGPPEPASCSTQTAGNFQDFATSPGDVRVVEFSYRVSHQSGDWTVGFQEARSTLDTSRVANDDKTQFLGSAFVNNPTISLPGSAIGLSWQRAIGTGRNGVGAATDP